MSDIKLEDITIILSEPEQLYLPGLKPESKPVGVLEDEAPDYEFVEVYDTQPGIENG